MWLFVFSLSHIVSLSVQVNSLFFKRSLLLYFLILFLFDSPFNSIVNNPLVSVNRWKLTFPLLNFIARLLLVNIRSLTYSSLKITLHIALFSPHPDLETLSSHLIIQNTAQCWKFDLISIVFSFFRQIWAISLCFESI